MLMCRSLVETYEDTVFSYKDVYNLCNTIGLTASNIDDLSLHCHTLWRILIAVYDAQRPPLIFIYGGALYWYFLWKRHCSILASFNYIMILEYTIWVTN